MAALRRLHVVVPQRVWLLVALLGFHTLWCVQVVMMASRQLLGHAILTQKVGQSGRQTKPCTRPQFAHGEREQSPETSPVQPSVGYVFSVLLLCHFDVRCLFVRHVYTASCCTENTGGVNYDMSNENDNSREAESAQKGERRRL